MRTIKLIHAADLHLDSPFEALSASKAAVRREEQRVLLSSLSELAHRESADLMLLGGDLFDSANTYYETGEELVRSLGNVPCPVIISPGNHDWYSARAPWAKLKLPENVILFRDNSMHFISIPSADARVYGAAFTERYSASLLRGFHAERKAGTYNLMCMHGEVGNPTSPYNPITEEDIAASGMDYIALGHVHTASGLLKSGNTWYSWPGCPEGRGFDETGEKTVNLVELKGESCTLRTVSIAQRRYEELEIDVTGTEPLLAIHTSLPDDTVCDVYRLTLTAEAETAPSSTIMQSARAIARIFFIFFLLIDRFFYNNREKLSLTAITDVKKTIAILPVLVNTKMETCFLHSLLSCHIRQKTLFRFVRCEQKVNPRL